MINASGLLLFLGLLTSPGVAGAAASLILTPRFEAVQGSEGSLAQRGLLRSKINADWGPYTVYLEGFGEFEMVENERERRRLDERSLFLQEAYLEFKLESFYLRAGKQAMRWSEMWVRPSLDVWTSRRWNRFLFDPQPEQLDHSGGVSASFAGQGYAFDAVVVNEIARDEMPEPLPRFIESRSEEINLGVRASFDFAGVGLRLVSARHNWKDTNGVALNYAFEKFVPKVEVGQIQDRAAFPAGQSDDKFVALGVDLFLGDWTLQPQATWYDFGDGSQGSRDYQTLFYLGGTWVRSKIDLQFQTFGNTATSDFFLNVFCAYNLKDWMQLGAFVQNYEGSDGGLFDFYKRATGGWVGGIRLELNTGVSSDGG